MGAPVSIYIKWQSTSTICFYSISSVKLRIKRRNQADLSEYYSIQSQHKSWDNTVKNRNIIPDFPRSHAVATFRLISGHDCLAAHLHGPSIYSPTVCVLCNEGKP
jgi:hypothetical protein